jgi:hypothetical protein
MRERLFALLPGIATIGIQPGKGRICVAGSLDQDGTGSILSIGT